MAPVRKRAQSRGAKPEGRKKRKGVAATGTDVVVKKNKRDEEILSEDEDERVGSEGEAVISDEEEEELDVETADEKRLRIAKAYLDRTRQAAADAEVCSFCNLPPD